MRHQSSRLSAQQSWRRVLGLSSRALALTVQRLLDTYSIYKCWTGTGAHSFDGAVLLVGLSLTSVLMAVTMRRHWSGLRGHRPHGTAVAVVSSMFQVAPIIEMLDKVLSHGQPRGFGRTQRDEPLLRSTPPKGSPGENAMRGVRKLSMVNLPQAMLSIWFHIGLIVPISGQLTEPQHPAEVACAFIAALFSLSFGIADFVLYVWVDDVFVKDNKKLVTLHYCLEVLSRLPPLVLFHITTKTTYGYMPMTLLFTFDVLVNSLLLQAARVFQHRRCLCCWPPEGVRHSMTQCMFSFVVSLPLFFVNIVFCDPGMTFFYVNQLFYIVKYLELVWIWHMISIMRAQVKNDGETMLWGITVLQLPDWWWSNFWRSILFIVFLNGCLIWCVAPSRRQEKDRLLSGYPNAPGRAVPEIAALQGLSVTQAEGGSASAGARRVSFLQHLEGVFELLLLLSKASCSRNRAQLLQLIVDELWYQLLPWNGVYDDGTGKLLRLCVDPRSRVVSIQPIVNPPAAVPEASAFGLLADGKLVVKQETLQSRKGRFDGCSILWDDGAVWTRSSSSSGVGSNASATEVSGSTPSAQMASAVLKLILPQLALALRWDDATSVSSTPRSASLRSDLETGAGSPNNNYRGPLLNFLIGYAQATKQTDVLSDLYWALVCLSHEEDNGADLGYRNARILLLEVVHCGENGNDEFLSVVRRILRGQVEVWHQNMELILRHSGRTSGGGSWSHKTEAMRSALRRWPELRCEASTTRIPDRDERLLRMSSGDHPSPPPLVDMVSPGDEGMFVSLPIDPMVQFRGIIIDESEVVPSKQAPLLLTCKTRGMRTRLLSTPHQTPRSSARASEEEVQEKYLLKIGDDLRQDQLMLQMMALMSCVWEEHLSPEESSLLQIANFRALAVTPQAGYVKFVADSVPLSDALRQSRGNLAAWLEINHLRELPLDEVLDNFCGSVAACCVVTYVLGIGDRHLENLCITRRGQFFHIDFSFILGDDPKPMAPPVRLPQQVAQALLATNRLSRCFALAGRAYLALRPFVGLFTSILQLTAATGGGGCTRLAKQPLAAVAGVRERLRVGESDAERAVEEFLCLMRESSEGLASIFIDKVHAAGLFWR